jgi:formylglycine-generating enzyme required for sulfatase activity
MKKITLLSTLLSFFTVAFANNVQVLGVSYNGNTHRVTFTLSWENSWDLTGQLTAPGNHDAVWIFVKVQSGSEVWSHMNLSTTAGSHTTGSNLMVAQPAAMNPTGILIKRSSIGYGNINNNNTVTLQLNTTTVVSAIQVFAVEMVYISEGSFGVGHSNPISTIINAFRSATISSEDLIPALGPLLVNTQDIPAAFPKGYKAFYVMKYEISQGQYTDFLNALTRTQQIARVGTDISGTTVTNRYVMTNQPTLLNYNHIMCPAAISATGPVIFSCGVPEKACNYLGWADFASYLDWAGLRPISELEFEKICRGFDPLENNQYIWGGTLGAGGAIQLSVIDADLPTETSASADPVNNTANLGVVSATISANSGRLMRCGFPGSKPINRALAGATYFGVMEMAGNVGEYILTIEFINGYLFTGENGNGDLSDIPSFWPDHMQPDWVVIRGGAYIDPPSHPVLIHFRGTYTTWNLSNNNRQLFTGGRGALSL